MLIEVKAVPTLLLRRPGLVAAAVTGRLFGLPVFLRSGGAPRGGPRPALRGGRAPRRGPLRTLRSGGPPAGERARYCVVGGPPVGGHSKLASLVSVSAFFLVSNGGCLSFASWIRFSYYSSEAVNSVPGVVGLIFSRGPMLL